MKSTFLFKTLSVCLVLLFLSACAQTKVMKKQDYEIANDSVSVVLMPIDIQLSALTAGGVNEVRADWTAAANEHMATAIKRELQAHNDSLSPYKAPADAAIRDKHTQIIKLHAVVGSTILLYSSVPAAIPPTKRDSFDWSLGKEIASLREDTGADYGLFVYMRDSYSTAGRKAVMAASALLGVGIQGGTQIGFSTLIDLRDGNVVWFNRLFSTTGDLRTESSATSAVQQLLKDIPL